MLFKGRNSILKQNNITLTKFSRQTSKLKKENKPQPQKNIIHNGKIQKMQKNQSQTISAKK